MPNLADFGPQAFVPPATPRDLAPILETMDACAAAMKQACKDGSMLQYRIAGSKRKHGVIDIVTCAGVAQLWEGASDKTKESLRKLYARLGNNPGKLGQAYWTLVAKAKGK